MSFPALHPQQVERLKGRLRALEEEVQQERADKEILVEQHRVAEISLRERLKAALSK